MCGMAPAVGDATGWDDSGTDSPCPFLCSGDGDFWTEYGTHSLRSSGTTAAARAHVAERLIQRHGGWKSASSKNCYISDSLEDALSVSRAVLQ